MKVIRFIQSAHSSFDDCEVILKYRDDERTREALKQVNEFWMGWEARLLQFREPHIAGLYKIAERCVITSIADNRNAFGLREEFKTLEGYFPLTKENGVELVSIEAPDWEDLDLEIEEVS